MRGNDLQAVEGIERVEEHAGHLRCWAGADSDVGRIRADIEEAGRDVEDVAQDLVGNFCIVVE